jgi:hypothetical protein
MGATLQKSEDTLTKSRYNGKSYLKLALIQRSAPAARVPALERAMMDNELEPGGSSALSKNRATPPTVPFFYGYTVFFGDEQFTRHRAERHQIPRFFL